MPATRTVSAWRNRAVDRSVAVAGMARSYRRSRCITLNRAEPTATLWHNLGLPDDL